MQSATSASGVHRRTGMATSTSGAALTISSHLPSTMACFRQRLPARRSSTPSRAQRHQFLPTATPRELSGLSIRKRSPPVVLRFCKRTPPRMSRPPCIPVPPTPRATLPVRLSSSRCPRSPTAKSMLAQPTKSTFMASSTEQPRRARLSLVLAQNPLRVRSR